MRMSRVYIPSEGVVGTVTKLLAFGAEVQYTVEGIYFKTFLPDEEYIELERLDVDE